MRLGDLLERLGELAVVNVRVAGRRGDVGVVQRALDEDQIAGLPQQTGRGSMSQVVETKVLDAGPPDEALPLRLTALIADRVRWPRTTPRSRFARFASIREHVFGVLALHRLQDLGDRRRDRRS